MKSYTVLHLHSHFSLLDGLSQPDQIIQRLQNLNIDQCAITDHGNCSGAIEFLKNTTKNNIKPLLGCEFYVSEFNAKIQDNTNRSLSHLLIFAKNDNGYKKLIQLISEGNLPEHFYYKPRLSLEQLSNYAGDLIFISGHLGSTISNNIDGAIEHVNFMKEKFGEDNFFLEVQLVDQLNNPDVKILADRIRDLGKKTNTKCVATPDAHYCTKEDAQLQRILLCRNLGGKTLEEARQNDGLSCFFKSNSFHIPSYQEMLDNGNTEEELDNTNYVASLCQEYKEILKPPQLPQFICPAGYNTHEWLRQLCRDGWKNKVKDRISQDQHQTYIDRIKFELNIIESANLSSYFLIVQDILQYVQNHNWLPGPGRGSAAGCLISYLVGITQIDPIKYNLLFSRFYNEGRNTKDHISLPDIDIDVPSVVRDDVIQYIKNQYGENKVAQMITFTTLKGRNALKDTLRAYGMPFTIMNEITKHIPDEAKIAGDLQEMKEETGESSIILWTLENDKKGKLKDWCYIEDNELKGPLVKRFEQAIKLEGTKASQSKHAAGIVITPKPLYEMCPMIYDAKSKNTVAGYEMESLEDVGCLKLDILGISMLSKIMGVVNILKGQDI